MQPVNFNESNVTYAKNQPEYLPLPVYKTPDGEVISCWKLTFREKLAVMLHGKVWINILTFNSALQPLRPYIFKPDWMICKKEEKL